MLLRSDFHTHTHPLFGGMVRSITQEINILCIEELYLLIHLLGEAADRAKRRKASMTSFVFQPNFQITFQKIMDYSLEISISLLFDFFSYI